LTLFSAARRRKCVLVCAGNWAVKLLLWGSYIGRMVRDFFSICVGRRMLVRHPRSAERLFAAENLTTEDLVPAMEFLLALGDCTQCMMH
jgi:hypothetical protein